jgi:phage terminase large subunit-like protein
MRQVLGLRTKLDQLVNKLILSRMALATRDLDAHIPKLNAVTEKISATTKTIDSVKQVLVVADEVVTIAAQIAAVVI